MQLIILRIATRYISPLLFAISLLLLWRGHNLPGGGFIGGLIAAAAFLLLVLGYGWNKVYQKLHLAPVTFIGIGLALAGSTSLLGLFGGEAFFQGLWFKWIGVKLGTPLLFDCGVYLLVLGFVLKSAQSLNQGEDR